MTLAMRGFMERLAASVEAELNRLLPAESTNPSSIHRAMRYSACGGGKRLRAILAMEAASLRGGPAERALPLAASLEMIHAYSLIHDDLPCMDDDDYRRGKPTNHRVFGEGIAVLAGDALLTQAFVVLGRLPELVGVTPAVALRVVAEVAQAASTAGLVGGQVEDLEAEGHEPGRGAPELLRAIHTRKTGALFRCSLRTGALIGGLSEAELAHLDRFAQHFGLAFQIVDDVLDVMGDASATGKAVGSDARQAKLTYPRVYGLERSREMAREAVVAAKESLEPFAAAADRLVQLANFVVERDR
jgi:geranylgeranyl diphosphate synthase type II